MKTILSSRRHRYLGRVGTFLIAVVLVVGMVGCGDGGGGDGESYTLTIASTAGGSVITPGEGTYNYSAGWVVDLVATPDAGYRFVEWTGDVGTIADVEDATTTITMNGDYFITASFAPEISENMEIQTWYDLDAVRDNLGGHHILMNDLDSTTAGYEKLASPTANAGKGWQPIGTETDPFTGALDGQGYEIRDLFINRPDEYECSIGLFGRVDDTGVIEDIGVVNASVTGYIFVGSLVGANAGTVSNSYSTGSVTGTGTGMFGSTVGGLLGLNGGAVSDSHSIGSVSGKEQVGGLVGVNGYGALGTVSNSYSSSNVTGVEDVGGLVGHNGGGENGGTVSNSYSSSNVTGVEDVGGLLGWNGGAVSNSYSIGSVTGTSFVGGLVGESAGTSTVNKSFWDTETSGQSSSDGGTGKTTAQMKSLATFSGAGWDIIEVVDPTTPNPAYIWNIPTTPPDYPFLSWQP